MRLANGTLPWAWIDHGKAVPWAEKRIGLALAERQVAAIRLALMSKVLVITGGPGVGKTTIVRGIVEIFTAKKLRVAALCPDRPGGKEARRIDRPRGEDHPPLARSSSRAPAGSSGTAITRSTST